jgi:hypothetical protein
MRGNEQDVIERQRFPDDTHVTFSYAQKRIIPAPAGPENRPRRRLGPPATARLAARAALDHLTGSRHWITLPMS